jgi:medium-chain acyl-[acyl-carrier-protein] hydrolase
MPAVKPKRSPVSFRAPNPHATIRLFCFPYAGGGSATYRDWQQKMPADIEVAAVQLPGREWRIEEPLISDMKALAADALESIRPFLDKPYALLGTSMGGTLIFELARLLRAAGLPAPRCLLPFACGAPHTPETKIFHTLPDEDLLEEIRDFGVMADEVSAHPEMLDLLLPILRADCTAHETNVCEEQPPFDFPVWVYGGIADDTVDRERLDAWAIHTNADSRVHMINGGHLFVDAMPAQLLDSLARRLYQSVV